MSLCKPTILFRRSGLTYLSAFQHSWKYSTKKYTQDHEWIEVNGNVATLGLTKYATKHLGEIVFAEIPDVGSKFGKGDSVAAVESVKAVGEVYSPVSGDVVERNEALADDFSLLNDNPESEGWICKIQFSDESETQDLMDKEKYDAYLESQKK